ncbi:MAG: YihY family inner membrane protein [Betaproteobacteria bacterium]|nr:YihY family inner membrane protein [Betaproteobacteria bacterium]
MRLLTANVRLRRTCQRAWEVRVGVDGMIEIMIVSQLLSLPQKLLHFPWRRAIKRLMHRFADDRLGQTAGALTFTTLIALVPLLTVALAVVTAFPVFDQFQTVLQRWLVESLIPESISRQVLGYLTQFTTKASRLGSWGFAALMMSAVALMLTIDRSLNTIWRVRQQRAWGQRLLLYWGALTLGPLLVAAGLVTMASVISWSGGSLRYQGPGVKMALGVLEFLLLWGGISGLYRFVPNTRVAWRPLLIGAFFTALVLQAARSGLTFYLASMPTFSLVYGTFATVPILLVWIYTTWVVVLLGAVLVASWPSLVQDLPDEQDVQAGRTFALALGCLRLLHQARVQSAGGLNAQQLSQRSTAALWEVQEVLGFLVQLDWVGRLNEHHNPRYVLLVDVATTPAAPLIDHCLLADTAHTQAVWARWQDWRLSALL